MTRVVALDDDSTWPDEALSLADQFSTDAEPDDWYAEHDALAVEALSGHRVLAYHCTRLTPREMESVHTSGLQVLSADLVRSRLAAAVVDGFLSQEEADFYGNTSLPRSPSRAGMIWSSSHRRTLEEAHQVGYLLETWGGEGINMNLSSRSAEFARLESVGSPCVVVLQLDFEIHYARGGPGLLTSMVRDRLGFGGGTTIQTRVNIEPSHVVDIALPGSEFWTDHVWTPIAGFRFDR